MKRFKIFPYNLKFPRIFEERRKKISKFIKNCEIHHIGSTAVPGLGGKGIIDIMIAIKSWQQAGKIVKSLRSIDFGHMHPKERGKIFLSNKKECGFGDFHLQIVKNDSKVYNSFLTFRDYLRKNKREIERFYKLKLKWYQESEGDRKKYNKLKEEYVKEILNRRLWKKRSQIYF